MDQNVGNSLFNDMVDLLEDKRHQTALKSQRELIIARNTDYVVDPSFDDLGLPAESPVYVKKSCKKCYGRGYQIFVAPKGFKVEETDVKRQYIGCACQNKTYDAMRKMVEKFESDQQAMLVDDLRADLATALPRLLKLGTKYFDETTPD